MAFLLHTPMAAAVLYGGAPPPDPATVSGLVYRVDPASGGYQERGANTTPAADGQPLGRLVPLVGEAAFAAPAADANRPTFVAAGLNGRPVVKFDGTNDRLKAAFTLAQPYTRVMVWRHRSAHDNNHVMADGNTDVTAYLNFVSANTLRMYAGSGGPSVSGLSNDTWYTSAEVYDGALNSTLRLNGGAAAEGGPGAGNPGGLTFGSQSNGDYFTDCDLAYVLVWDRALAAAEQNVAFAWLRSRFAHY